MLILRRRFFFADNIIMPLLLPLSLLICFTPPLIAFAIDAALFFFLSLFMLLPFRYY